MGKYLRQFLLGCGVNSLGLVLFAIAPRQVMAMQKEPLVKNTNVLVVPNNINALPKATFKMHGVKFQTKIGITSQGLLQTIVSSEELQRVYNRASYTSCYQISKNRSGCYYSYIERKTTQAALDFDRDRKFLVVQSFETQQKQQVAHRICYAREYQILARRKEIFHREFYDTNPLFSHEHFIRDFTKLFLFKVREIESREPHSLFHWRMVLNECNTTFDLDLF